MEQLLHFTWVDFTIAIVILLSTLISLTRGFIKEAISLATWIIGFWVAFKFYDQLASLFANLISNSSIRTVVSFLIIFFAVLIFGAIFNFLVSMLIIKTGLSGTDRILGTIFGLARGVLLVGVLIMLIATTAFTQDEWWKNSVLIPHFKVVTDWIHSVLPAKFTSELTSAVNSSVPPAQ